VSIVEKRAIISGLTDNIKLKKSNKPILNSDPERLKDEIQIPFLLLFTKKNVLINRI
jgi:hypothetical protein